MYFIYSVYLFSYTYSICLSCLSASIFTLLFTLPIGHHPPFFVLRCTLPSGQTMCTTYTYVGGSCTHVLYQCYLPMITKSPYLQIAQCANSRFFLLSCLLFYYFWGLALLIFEFLLLVFRAIAQKQGECPYLVASVLKPIVYPGLQTANCPHVNCLILDSPRGKSPCM